MARHHSFSRDGRSRSLLTDEQKMSRRAALRRLAEFALAGGTITTFAASCGSRGSYTPASPVFHTDTSTSVAGTNAAPSLKTADYTFRGHSASVNSVVWSPDGKRLASSGNDGTVQLWDAFTGAHVFTYRGHVNPNIRDTNAYDAVWSPDGKRLASCGRDGTVQVWQPV